MRAGVVQYLYVHGEHDRFHYPSARTSSGGGRLAARYLECALVQAASLRLRDADCDLAFVTNDASAAALGGRGAALLSALEGQGAAVVTAPYEHRPGDPEVMFYASRYVLDAIRAVAAAGPADRVLAFTDVDCVWLDPAGVLAAVPERGVGCVQIAYPPGWDVSGITREGVGALARELGGAGDGPPPWVGGELLAGRAGELLALVDATEALDAELAARGRALPTEEQVLSLAGALGRVAFCDLSAVAGRVWTGPRHGAVNPPHPEALGLWHLPAEKGLSFRRAAREVLRRRPGRLRRDLADVDRAMRRFNVEGRGGVRARVRDDAWLTATRLRERAAAALHRG